jgi:hypothetical protein
MPRLLAPVRADSVRLSAATQLFVLQRGAAYFIRGRDAFTLSDLEWKRLVEVAGRVGTAGAENAAGEAA